MRGGIDPGDHRCRPRVVESIDAWKVNLPGNGTLSSPGAAGPRSWPKGDALASTRPSQQKVDGAGVSTTYGAVSIRGITAFVSGLLKQI